ncbi:glycerate kinase [Psychrobacter phenylpyruvicus]|uniref:Glycerate kinase n=1 Tax=Psychrobacter phenylpyruvicus TaxID=29432 RepID=A0A379LK42_9GAMM|nr:glycerate kinase [Psychrobacter phenylpyruvicus]SUD90913.1 Glycerate kinase [Psychrobacter phenylpyruvicus]
MNILIAPDSFKESLEAIDVCSAIKQGFSQVFPEASYTLLPLADGGEGTSAVLSYVLHGQWQQLQVHDPLMRPITAKYFLTVDGIAVIEIAEACGLHLLAKEERNPLLASSFGVGEMMVDAIQQGATNILIGLGGSATNDAGAGMLQALGVKLQDATGTVLKPGGGNLNQLHSIKHQALQSLLSGVTISVACDVTSPLCGPTGASHVFGPQKGATVEEVLSLDKALAHFATVTHTYISGDDCSHIEGAGAAGGLGFALMAYCQAELKSGFDTIAKMVELDRHLAKADLVITGEGKLDAQTAMGKVASGVALRTKAINPELPVIAICGSVDYQHTSLDSLPKTDQAVQQLSPQDSPFDAVFASIHQLDSMQVVLKNAYPNVRYTALQVASTLSLGRQLFYTKLHTK